MKKHNKTLTIKEQQDISLRIMKYIHKVCEDNNLVYFLFGGSCLGAVRHKGFIPWDDDIDIALPHDDYKKLLKILSKQNDYVLLEPYNSDFALFFSKLCDKDTVAKLKYSNDVEGLGVWVDIFPLNNLGDTHEEALRYVKKCCKKFEKIHRSKILKKYYYSSNPLKMLVKFFIYMPEKIFYSFSYKEKKIKSLEYTEKKNNRKTKYIGCNCMCLDDIYDNKMFDRQIKMKFEDTYFMVNERYDEYLRARYGDYMTPPAKQDRKVHEGFFVWK